MSENKKNEIVIDQCFKSDTRNFGMLRKVRLSYLIPIQGAEIDDLAWKEPKKIKNIVISFIEDGYYLSVEDEYVKDEEDFNRRKEMFKGHGWNDAKDIQTRK